ncbi:hypothetical protein MUCCIDRAFT_156725 [Mucor lusitanicus CBS 277.49]|uniref:Uncharacterized protein n=1 Tax=Mucor lusitanicus CBS 277.49 TaxID=747725 RepID=A0A168JG11_MUCCL|nr:hypothetical protein MUCCIDRAFT_156725 [Mucor lusitanicus CBS 277.49]
MPQNVHVGSSVYFHSKGVGHTHKDPRKFSAMGQVFPVKLTKHQLDRSINWNQTDITFQLVQDLSVGFHSKGVANAYKRPSKFFRYEAGVYCKTDQASDKQ